MTWYGKTTSRQIESLLQSKPSLAQLLASTEFVQEIKTYNPKLLDYISSNPALISQGIRYMTMAPSHQDPPQRKHKLPLQTIELVQTDTTCILNGFFKEGEKGMHNLDLLFRLLEGVEILPLLAGYFFRTNLCLLNNRYKQTVEWVYTHPAIFDKLIVHSEHMAISNTIQLFLNLDTSKNPPSQDKLTLRKQVLKKILRKIRQQSQINRFSSAAIVENLSGVLIEMIDKYHLIVDGKQMIDAASDGESVSIMMGLVRSNNQHAFASMAYFIALINYYSFSSHNTEQHNPEVSRKALERIEAQPMITELIGFFPTAMSRIMTCQKIDLYHYRLLEVLCHCISIASMRVFRAICDCHFFASLIELLFKHHQNNVLHMLIEKSFYHVFISDRKIYEQYKRHLFCEMDIIKATVSRIMGLFDESKFFEEARQKGYFGHFMRILKIYSGIQPTDEQIINAIKLKTTLWNQVSELLIKPYENICFKQLGSYQNVPSGAYQEFIVRENPTSQKTLQNSSLVEEINLEEHFPKSSGSTHSENENPGSHRNLFDIEPPTNLNLKGDIPLKKEKPTPISVPALPEHPKLKEKKPSYEEFISKKGQQVSQQLRTKRSVSAEKKLSRSGSGRMVSPSPKKADKWMTKSNTQQELKPGQKSKPMIPPSSHQVQGPHSNLHMHPGDEPRRSRSLNIQEIKKIRVIQIDPPKEKKYRRAEEKDRMFLEFLGINV